MACSSVAVAFVASLVLAWIVIWWTRRHVRVIEKPLGTPHVSELLSLEHRVDAARRDALGGFRRCACCGFDNFRRARFCGVCSTQLRLLDECVGVTSFETLVAMSEAAADDDVGHAAISVRQRRVRQRKEWTRKLDVEGKPFWFRRCNTGPRFPGFAVRFKHARDARWQHQAAETTTRTRKERVQSLTDEVHASSLAFRSASKANPVVSPLSLPVSFKTPVEVLVAATAANFPTKYAKFVASTSRILQESGTKTLRLHLHRADLFHQSIQLLSEIPSHYINALLRVSFVGESGVDAGGLHREWFVLVSRALADPACGVFKCTNESDQSLALNDNSEAVIGSEHLMYFHAAGRFIGRALLEGTAVGFHLATPLLKLILGLPLTFGDLEHFDPEVYRSLLWLLENNGVDALGLDFSVTVRRGADTTAVDLIPSGRDVAVTDANKRQFVERKWQFLMVENAASQLYVFLKGVYEVLPYEQLVLFDSEELDFVLCGSSEIDVDDWEQNTRHSESLAHSPVRKWFWEIVREMPSEYQRRLLQFATGSDRVPHSGFRGLTSHDGQLCAFSLIDVPLASSEYVWSHSCFNQLDLPLYRSRSRLRSVLYAVLNTELYGFTTV